MLLRSIYRSSCYRSLRCSNSSYQQLHHALRHYRTRSFSYLSPLSPRSPAKFLLPVGIVPTRSFSADVTHMPVIKDPELQNVFKDLMAADWDKIPNAVIYDAKKALSKNTDDKVGQEVLLNVLRSAEAVEEFGSILVSLKMAIDDSIGLSGEDVKPMSEEFKNALETVYKRYTAYLDAFGPDEVYLKKKVESELGRKMIHLKMRCSSLGSEWGKVGVLGTSGLSGSYVEQRAA